MLTAPALLGLFWFGWAIYWILSARTTAPTAWKANSAVEILYRIPLLTGILLLAFPSPKSLRLISLDFNWQNGLGLLLVLIGLAIAIWARRHLGMFWSARVTVKTDHQLIRTGPYQFVRHPIYSGLILALLGTSISLGTWQSLLGFGLISASFIWKLAFEERLLSLHLGQSYLQYRRHVRALIPFVI
jgi:protein-S-isoprenylcysteine O-methyltransferase Ste14